MFLERSRQVKLYDKTLRGDPSRVYYSKLNKILIEFSWGDPGRLKLYYKDSREIPVEYIILTNQLLSEHTRGDPGRKTLDVKNKHP
jgi:hypothetical protein